MIRRIEVEEEIQICFIAVFYITRKSGNKVVDFIVYLCKPKYVNQFLVT